MYSFMNFRSEYFAPVFFVICAGNFISKIFRSKRWKHICTTLLFYERLRDDWQIYSYMMVSEFQTGGALTSKAFADNDSAVGGTENNILSKDHNARAGR